jgi:N-acetylmuramoyl-L-alanine amidase
MTLAPDSPLVADLHPSPNIDERRGGVRPWLLVLHYTGLPTVERSIEVLADPRCKVSCHYVIALDGRITQMVAESVRGWHAGVSYWRGERDINSASIGIEIQNPGHNAGYPAFPVVQMMAVRDLSLDICRRNGIGPAGVLAHSDVAPGRKIDPGERFDWPWLARAGVGHWVVPEPIGWDAGTLGLGDEGEAVRAMQLALARYGYGIEVSGVFDARAEQVVAAFQRHFRPQRVDGRYDASTAISLRRLSDALAVA